MDEFDEWNYRNDEREKEAKAVGGEEKRKKNQSEEGINCRL